MLVYEYPKLGTLARVCVLVSLLYDVTNAVMKHGQGN